MQPELVTIGWREWLGLPGLEIPRLKAKIDSGARTSSLHADDVELYRKGGVEYVRFRIRPLRSASSRVLVVEHEVLEHRHIRSSNGQRTLRPVIHTEILFMGQRHFVDLTLADRSKMKFRMLLGREAMRGRFLIDSGVSFRGGRPKKRRRSSGRGDALDQGDAANRRRSNSGESGVRRRRRSRDEADGRPRKSGGEARQRSTREPEPDVPDVETLDRNVLDHDPRDTA